MNTVRDGWGNLPIDDVRSLYDGVKLRGSAKDLLQACKIEVASLENLGETMYSLETKLLRVRHFIQLISSPFLLHEDWSNLQLELAAADAFIAKNGGLADAVSLSVFASAELEPVVALFYFRNSANFLALIESEARAATGRAPSVVAAADDGGAAAGGAAAAAAPGPDGVDAAMVAVEEPQLLRDILPLVMIRWYGMYHAACMAHSLPVAELIRLFDSSPNEAKTLVASSKVCTPPSPDWESLSSEDGARARKEWCDESLGNVAAFIRAGGEAAGADDGELRQIRADLEHCRHIAQQRHAVRSILRFKTDTLRFVDAASDPARKQLEELGEAFETKWEEATLRDVHETFGPLLRDVLAVSRPRSGGGAAASKGGSTVQLESKHLDLIASLSHARDVLQLLLSDSWIGNYTERMNILTEMVSDEREIAAQADVQWIYEKLSDERHQFLRKDSMTFSQFKEAIVNLSDLHDHDETCRQLRGAGDSIEIFKSVNARFGDEDAESAQKAIAQLNAILAVGTFEVKRVAPDHFGDAASNIVCVKIESKSLAFEDLHRLRGTLMLGGVVKEHSEEESRVKEFVELIQLWHGIASTLSALERNGHPDYGGTDAVQERFLSWDVSPKAQRATLVRYRRSLDAWKVNLQKIRVRHTSLNAFSTLQLWEICAAFDDCNVPVCTRLLRLSEKFMHVCDEELRAEMLATSMTASKFGRSAESLERLAGVLHVERKSRPSSPVPTAAAAGGASRRVSVRFPNDLDHGVHFMFPANVVVLENKFELISLTTSLYHRVVHRPPQIDELVFCSSSTTLEELELLFHRCFGSKRKDALFCIGCCEKLTASMQSELVRRLHEIRRMHNAREGCYPLVLVTVKDGASSSSQHMLSKLSDWKHAQPYSSWSLEEEQLRILYDAWTGDREVCVVTSKLTGSGKSRYIRSMLKGDVLTLPLRRETSAANIVVRVNRHEASAASSAAADVDGAAASSDEPADEPAWMSGPDWKTTTTSDAEALAQRSLYIDVEEDSQDFELALYQLLLVGGIVADGTPAFATPFSRVFIELATLLSDDAHVAQRTAFTCFLRQDPVAEAFSFNIADEADIDAEHVVHVQRVLKWLRAYISGQLSSMDFGTADAIFCESGWLGLEEGEDVADDEAASILASIPELKEFNQRRSLVQRETFFAIASTLLAQFKECSFLNKSNMYEMQAPDLGAAFFGAVLRTALDFALPSIKIEGDGQSEERLFQMTRKWTDSAHPVTIFVPDYRSGGMTSPVCICADATALDLRFATTLNDNRMRLGQGPLRNYQDPTNPATDAEVQGLLRQVFSSTAEFDVALWQANEEQPGYALTVNSVFKMCHLWIRLQCRLPVVIMGETGCGKTSLIKYMAKLACISHLIIHDVHGGTMEADIDHKLREAIVEAELLDNSQLVVIFFDEVNTANCMGYFKMIICDRQWSGGALPSNLLTIAACNPYRLKPPGKEHGASIGLQAVSTLLGGGGSSQRSKLEYNVHPLPLSMASCAYDYGALAADEEKSYISLMVRSFTCGAGDKPLFTTESERKGVIAALTRCQEFIRAKAGSAGLPKRSATSLREVKRFLQIVRFFRDRYFPMWNQASARGSSYRRHSIYLVTEIAKNSILLAIAHCYAIQLPTRDRIGLWRELSRPRAIYNVLPYTSRYGGSDYPVYVHRIQRSLLEKFDMPDGIVLNEALCENVFTMLTCIHNRLPLIIVGQPGSSKTLAMRLVRDNFSLTNKTAFFRDWPSVEVIPFQCSPLARAEGIEHTFALAQKKQQVAAEKNADVIVVVLLDEVGLAEQSPHRPLKVLHRLLEPTHIESGTQVACVGLSNWRLDAASMNRTTFLFRVPPSSKELAKFTSGIVGDRIDAHLGYNQSADFFGALADKYLKLVQRSADVGMEGYFGLRDLYGLLKAIARLLSGSNQQVEEVGLTPKLLLKCIARNFGGAGIADLSLQRIWNDFFKRDALRLFPAREVAAGSRRGVMAMPPLLELIRANISETREKPDDARHLLLLVPAGAELSILQTLQGQGVVPKQATIVLSSNFAEDTGDVHIGHRIEAIKQAMRSGDLLVLVHQKSIYESMYDMLNQHYQGWGDQQFCRISLGVHHKVCRVHQSFRCVVIADQMSAGVPNARDPLPAPFLNRFEKVRVDLKDVLHSQLQPLAQRMNRWARDLLTKSLGPSHGGGHYSKLALRKHFSGLDDFSSIVGAVHGEVEAEDRERSAGDSARRPRIDVDVLEPRIKERILWGASASLIGGLDPRLHHDEWSTYFERQEHGSLAGVLRCLVNSGAAAAGGVDSTGFTPGVDEFGSRAVVTTFSTVVMPTIGDDFVALKGIKHDESPLAGPFLRLGTCGSEMAVVRFLREFFAPECTSDVAFIVASLVSPARIQHTIFVCDKERRRYCEVLRRDGRGGGPKHIVIVRQVELQSAGGDVGSVGFNRRWLHAFVDEVSLDSDEDGTTTTMANDARAALPPMSTLVAVVKPISRLFDGGGSDNIFNLCFGDLVASEMRTTLLVDMRYPPELDSVMSGDDGVADASSSSGGGGDASAAAAAAAADFGLWTAARRINAHLDHLRTLTRGGTGGGGDAASARFCRILARVVSQQMRKQADHDGGDDASGRWQCRVARRLAQRQSTAGSLRLGLSRAISNEVSRCVATTLAFLDRGLNTLLLAAVNADEWRRDLWLDLFECSTDFIVQLPQKLDDTPVVVDRVAQRAFPCRAPFSFRVIKHLSELEADVMESSTTKTSRLEEDGAIAAVARHLAQIANTSSCYQRWSAAVAYDVEQDESVAAEGAGAGTDGAVLADDASKAGSQGERATPCISTGARDELFRDYVADLVSHNFGASVASALASQHVERVLQSIVEAGVESIIREMGASHSPCRIALAHVVLWRHRLVMSHVPGALAPFSSEETQQAADDFIGLVRRSGVSGASGDELAEKFTRRAFEKLRNVRFDLMDTPPHELRRWCRAVEQMVAATAAFGEVASGDHLGRLAKLHLVSRVVASVAEESGGAESILGRLRAWLSSDVAAVRRCCVVGSFEAIWKAVEDFSPPEAAWVVVVPIGGEEESVAAASGTKEWSIPVAVLDVYLLDFCCDRLRRKCLSRGTTQLLVSVALGTRRFATAELNEALLPMRAALMRHLVIHAPDELHAGVNAMSDGAGASDISATAAALFAEATSDCSEYDGIDNWQRTFEQQVQSVAAGKGTRVDELQAIGAGCCFVRLCATEMPHGSPGEDSISDELRAVMPDVLTDDESLCVVCMDQPTNYTFKICGHQVLCTDCAAIMVGMGNTSCPICRTDGGGAADDSSLASAGASADEGGAMVPSLREDLRTLLLKHLFAKLGEQELIRFLRSSDGQVLLPWGLEHVEIEALFKGSSGSGRSTLRDVLHASPFHSYADASAIVISAANGAGDATFHSDASGTTTTTTVPTRSITLALAAECLAKSLDTGMVARRSSAAGLERLRDEAIARPDMDQLLKNFLSAGRSFSIAGADVLGVSDRLLDDPEWQSIALVAADVVSFSLTCSSASPVAAAVRALIECVSNAALKRAFMLGARDDETATVIAAVRASSTFVYRCPNGHLYAVGGSQGGGGSCVHQMQAANCRECGARIGQGSGTRQATAADLPVLALPGWYATTELNATEVQRTLAPTTLHALRFIVNAALASGATVRGGALVGGHEYTSSMKAAWDNLRELLGANSEDTALFMHTLLDDLAKESPKHVPATRTLCRTTTERAAVETAFAAVCAPLKETWAARLRTAHDRLGELLAARDETTKSAALKRLRDEDDERDLPRRRLFRIRDAVTFPLFIARFNSAAMANAARFPLLAWLLEQDDGGRYQNRRLLRATTHLPAVIHWQSLIFRAFNRRRSSGWANRCTVRECIKEVSRFARNEDVARAAYKGYCEAWHLAKPYVEMCELEQAEDGGGAKDFPNELTLDSPVLFSLPHGENEGRFVTLLIRLLVATHNGAIDVVAPLARDGGGGGASGDRAAEQRQRLPMHHLTIVDVARKDVLDGLEKKAVDSAGSSPGAENSNYFDFGRVERWLRSHLVLGTRRLTWEGMSTFIFEMTYKEAAEEQMKRLLGRYIEHIVPLTPAEAQRVRNVLAQSAAALPTIRRRLDESVGYLRFCPDAALVEIFDRPLYEFVANTAEQGGEEEEKEEGGAVASKVAASSAAAANSTRDVDLGPLAWLQREGSFLKMSHLRALYNEIDGVMQGDAWHGTPPAYCAAITPVIRQQLRRYRVRLLRGGSGSGGSGGSSAAASKEDEGGSSEEGHAQYDRLLQVWGKMLRKLARETDWTPLADNPCFAFLNYDEDEACMLNLDLDCFTGMCLKHLVEGYKIWADDAAAAPSFPAADSTPPPIPPRRGGGRGSSAALKARPAWGSGGGDRSAGGGRAAAAAKGGEDDDDELARALALSMVPNVRHAPAAAATAVDADALAQVEAMGFSRQRASEALRACNNAVDRAIARLLERS